MQIIPTAKGLQYADEKTVTPMEIQVYSGADGTFLLYEDEGNNYNFEKGSYAVRKLNWNDEKGELTVGEIRGNFAGMEQFVIKMHGDFAKSIEER